MNKKTQMNAILIHGMGRTPVAMSILAARLRASNIHPHLFGYSVVASPAMNERALIKSRRAFLQRLEDRHAGQGDHGLRNAAQ